MATATEKARNDMQVTPETTVGELQGRFPNGFAIGPGSPDDVGTLSRILTASSHINRIIAGYPVATGNQGYLVVDMDEAREEVPDA